ncbi:MAG TPA: DUF72 domain-containing protein [Vicinamibacteria bacterium]|nr:DUF72 domain-containing protein [Vicinamibacteria bacterium]
MAEESELHRGLTKRPARVGVAGWSYPDWGGIVYPKTPRFDGLSYLATLFDTLEINSSFYRIPTSRTTASWAKRVLSNPEFRFTLKLYKGFTHERTATAGDELMFAEALAPLTDAGVLGALLLQFPWSFKNDPESRDYLSTTLERFARHPLVVEVRHASWNQGEFYSFLAERGVGFCNIDQPLIGRSLAPSDRATGPVGYVRLHGRNYRDWFREDAGRDARYNYLYSEEELDPWVEKISEVSGTASSTYVITNNHFRGQAVVNALQIRSRIEKRKVTAPASLLDHYPVLARSAEPDSPVQPGLF